MKIKKKGFSFVCLILCLFGILSLAGCKKQEEQKDVEIVCSIYPIYNWMEELTKDVEGVHLTLLAGNGVDMHSYQPSAKDMITISTCDLFVYVGGESDGYVADALKQSKNQSQKALSLMELLGEDAFEEELVEGMQGEEEAGEDDAEEIEYDEHVWLSLKNAIRYCDIFTKALEEKLPEQKEQLETNCKAYTESLAALDAEYAETVKQSEKKTMIVGDRFPFRYLAEDYGIQYYAAFVGCSAESEASFDTIIFLAKKMDELKLRYMIVLDDTSHQLAQTIIDSTKDKDAEIVVMYSLQAVTVDQEGMTYLKAMQQNLAALKKVLAN